MSRRGTERQQDDQLFEMNGDREELWTLDDVAGFMRLRRRRVLELLPAGLPHLRVGKRQIRFRPEAVKAWIAAQESVASGSRSKR